MNSRVWKSIAASVAVLALVLGLCGCGTVGIDDGEVIRRGIAEELDLLKDPSEENLGKYIGGVDVEGLEAFDEYGLDVYEVLGHLLAKFDYEIGEVEIDGQTAQVEVDVSNADVAGAVQAAVDSLTDEEHNAELLELYESGDDKAYMQQLFSYIYEEIDASQDIVTTQAKLTLTKDGSAWNIDQGSLQELISAVYGGLDLGGL